MNCGWAGFEMSKMWMPSKPWPTSWPAHVEVVAPPLLMTRHRDPALEREVDLALADAHVRDRDRVDAADDQRRMLDIGGSAFRLGEHAQVLKRGSR